VLYSGAFGAGKSVALCAKALKLSLDYPKNYGAIFRKVRATLKETTLKTWTDLVCPRELIADYNKSEGLFTLTKGSKVLFGGLDQTNVGGEQRPLKLGSLNLGWAGIDEALETNEEDWKMVEGRLRLPGVPHQIFGATNPGPRTHYLFKLFWEQKRGEVFQSGSFDNPKLPEDYKRRLKEFDGVYYQRNVLGLWVGMEGLVYSSFDERVCVVPRFEIPKTWLVYSGHDFGDANPAALFYAQDPATGNFYIFAEYLPGGGRSIFDHVQKFKEITSGYNVLMRVGGSHQEGQIREGYTMQGWPITEPKHSADRKYQIQKVQGLHRLNKVFVFSDMANYLKEKLSFSYPKTEDGGLGDDPEDEKRYHLMAAERYILSEFVPETVKHDKLPVYQF